MNRPKPSTCLPYASSALAVAGLSLLGWQVVALRGGIALGRAEIQSIRSQLEAERGERASLECRAAELGRRAEDLGRSIAEAKVALASSGRNVGESIERLESSEAAAGAEISKLREDLAIALKRLDAEAERACRIKRRLESVAPDDYGPLLAPTVKISSKSDVGSGTVIYSRNFGDRWLSYVLTAHHIVEQNYSPRDPLPLEVISFVEGKKVRDETGIVVAVSADSDLALVEVKSERGYDTVARLVPPERVAGVKLYSRVCAIGCPLGYAPIPTSGELTSKSKVLEGQSYWMINAPTIFGNSGGGIYLSDTGELIGVLSRISAYKNLIDVAVPHMGIMTATNEVYAWLEREHYQFVVDPRYTPEECALARLAAGRSEGAPPAEAPATAARPSAAAASTARSN